MTGSLGVGKNHRLQHIDHLCDVSHAHPVGVAVEDIERQRSHKGVAHGVLLVEVAFYGAGFLVPPCSPFIYEQPYLLLRVFLVHDLRVALNHVFYLEDFPMVQ